jgi:hypothetical protein
VRAAGIQVFGGKVDLINNCCNLNCRRRRFAYLQGHPAAAINLNLTSASNLLFVRLNLNLPFSAGCIFSSLRNVFYLKTPVI